jgi:8-oxo-dGTP pyrophosphatase MutT (NUDIX family)
MKSPLTESERVEREEFARGHVPPGGDPVPARPASTLVLLRPGPPAGAAMEVLLLQRPRTSRFAAGAYVFPGGVVDPADAEVELAERLGPGVTGAEGPALVAALRELFEETGLLPADRLPEAVALDRGRRELLEGRAEFGELLAAWDLEFRGLRAAYLSRWVTPERLDRRYDARFFVAEHRGGEPELVGDELVRSTWLGPREALDRFRAGDLPLLFPTRRTMEELSRFEDLEELFAWAAAREVRAQRPRLRVEGDSVIPVLPGDPGYEEAR